MNENSIELNTKNGSSSITKYCHKLGEGISNQLESCDAGSKDSCFVAWELKDGNYKNLTDVVNNLMLRIKGCWVGRHIINNNCDFNRKMLVCYCSGDRCNSNDLPHENLLNKSWFFKDESKTPDSSNPPNQSHLIIYIFSILILFILVFFLFYRQRNKLKKKLNRVNKSINAIKQNHLNVIETQEPLLFKSTPKIIEHIRQGQYGNVYKGKIERRSSTEQLSLVHPGQQMMLDLEQTVAIKAYSQQMYDSFKHEYNVYNLPGIKHKNILKFISSEEKRISPNTMEYWLVLEYHQHGSLYDYLKRNLITYSQLIDICLDIATGLSHLHNLHNSNSCVVHRDLKSKNILLKSDLTACISDFNLALVLYPNQSASENLDQVGTVRYMSPELLDCAIQFSKEGLMKIDIYAVSLVFWEVLSRCSAQLGPVEPYSMPYEKELGTFLMKEQLRKHVSDNKRRPEIPQHWCDHSDLNELAKTINECWDQDPEARLTASGIVERLKRIKRKEF